MAYWLINHGPQIVHLGLAFFAGVVFAAWRQTTIEKRDVRDDLVEADYQEIEA